MIPIRYVALDMDDVCNRLTMVVLRWVGCPVDMYSYRDYPVEAGSNIVLAMKLITGVDGYSEQDFWDTVPRKIWAHTPLSDEFPWLLHRCAAKVGKENVYFLTCPTNNPDCLAGKLEWIHRNTPKWMHRQYMMGPPKQVCGRPDTLLIDDREANVDAFRADGGRAILMPRPWNRNRLLAPRIHIHQELGTYCAAT